MDTMSHIERFEAAVACKPHDRACYNNFEGGLLGRYGNPEFQPGDMYTRPSWAIDQIIAGAKKMGGDTAPTYMYAPMLTMNYTGTYYLTPGRELPPDSICQAIETNPFKDDHYDFIFEHGVKAWIDKYVVPNWPDYTFDEFQKGVAISMEYMKKWMAATAEDPWYNMPIPGWSGAMIFGMARGVVETLMDMYERPEDVARVVRMFDEFDLADREAASASMGGLAAVCVSAGRYDNKQAGADSFDETMWPSYKFFADYAAEHELMLIVHADGSWEESIKRHLHELPAEHTVFQCDGFTDVDKVADANRALSVWAEYAQNVFTVKFMVDDSVYQTDTYFTGDALALPANPVVEGKEFVGWILDDTDATAINGGEAVTSDMTILAQFKDEYYVRFVVMDGDEEVERLDQFFRTVGEAIGMAECAVLAVCDTGFALALSQKLGQTEFGQEYRLIQGKGICVLKCEDGDLTMPAYIVEFK